MIRINFGPGSAPAMYNDETIIESMTDIGYSLEDARNYVAIGCIDLPRRAKLWLPLMPLYFTTCRWRLNCS